MYIMLISATLKYFWRYLPLIFLATLAAAVARAIQLQTDPIPIVNIAPEAIVWASRIGVVLAVIGRGNLGRGWHQITQFDFSVPEFTKLYSPHAPLSAQAAAVVISTAIFAALIAGLNLASGKISTAITELGLAGFLNNPEPIHFFLKNMLVIPLTILFALCLTNYLFLSREAKK